MTRKHYILIADAIKDNLEYTADGTTRLINTSNFITDLCVVLKRDNSSFSPSKFVDYIAKEK